ncbi:MAG: prephenate dehydratase [Actinomycetes bacterium]
MTAVDGPAPQYAYLGPTGTFTEAALVAYLDSLGGPGSTAATAVSYPTVPAALDAVRDGAAVAAMVPLENSVGGSVPTTIDELAVGRPLVIHREVLLPVAFALLARPGTAMADVRTVAGHPQAHLQCRGWLRERLPQAEAVETSSNADAARLVADGRWDAALAAGFAARTYGLEILADGVHDVAGAQTRFVLVRPPHAPEPATGSDKTSLVLVIGQDHPGALLEILTEFAVRGINLTRIESRPTGGGIGDYFFAVDAEGHIDEARVGEALIGLHRICADVRYLGSYPRADEVRSALRRGVSDAEYGQAQAWLSRVRDGRA